MSVYEGLMTGLGEAIEHAEGTRELRKHKIFIEPVPMYNGADIKSIRNMLGMTQMSFANLMGVSKKTVEAWEAGKNVPDGPARRLLGMIKADPALPEKYRIVCK